MSRPGSMSFFVHAAAALDTLYGPRMTTQASISAIAAALAEAEYQYQCLPRSIPRDPRLPGVLGDAPPAPRTEEKKWADSHE